MKEQGGNEKKEQGGEKKQGGPGEYSFFVHRFRYLAF